MSSHEELTTLPTFEDLMAQGVDLNNAGNYELALQTRLQAYDLAPQNSVEAGRAARDIGHTYRALRGVTSPHEVVETADNVPDETAAATWLWRAVQIHHYAVAYGAPGAERELRATLGEWGTLCLQWALQHEGANKRYDKAAIQIARAALGDAMRGSEGDQYGVNFAARRAIGEALYPTSLNERTAAIAEARRLAPLSESQELRGSNPNISKRGRIKARSVARARAAVASTISRVSPEIPSYDEAPSKSLRRRVARRLATVVL